MVESMSSTRPSKSTDAVSAGMTDGLTVPMKNVRPMPRPAARMSMVSASPAAVHTSATVRRFATNTPAASSARQTHGSHVPTATASA